MNKIFLITTLIFSVPVFSQTESFMPVELIAEPGEQKTNNLFKLIENFGIEMITIPFQEDGPDLNAIEAILKKEKNVHGIACVPRHSNPTGHTYSDENVRSMFEMFSALNNNFMILWDNAYACHDLKNTIEQTNAKSLAKEFNLEDNLFQFGSTSKITLAGSGISFLSSSTKNLEAFIEYRNGLAVGPNKMNQGLHVEYFKKMPIKKQMQKMKEILLPKFEITKNYLNILLEIHHCCFPYLTIINIIFLYEIVISISSDNPS